MDRVARDLGGAFCSLAVGDFQSRESKLNIRAWTVPVDRVIHVH